MNTKHLNTFALILLVVLFGGGLWLLAEAGVTVDSVVSAYNTYKEGTNS